MIKYLTTLGSVLPRRHDRTWLIMAGHQRLKLVWRHITVSRRGWWWCVFIGTSRHEALQVDLSRVSFML